MAKLADMNALTAKTLLERNVLFRDLPETAIDKIAGLATIRSYSKGTLVFSQGDPGDAFFGVASGAVRISAISPEGEEIYLRVFEPGDTFGEIAVLDGQPRTASASTTKAAELVIIQREHFLDLLGREPKVAIHLLKLISERLRWTSALVEDAAFLEVPARLAKRLLSLASEQGAETTTGIEVKLSQEELAHYLSVSRQIVNQHLQIWRKQGWVDLARGRIIIVDEDALDDVAMGGDSD
jgi:CRP/FNR family cyclic AMP-dependent transcriptional regulator